MCGIFGIISPRNQRLGPKFIEKYNDKLWQLAIANTTRGQDSFGYFVIYSDGSFKLNKNPSPSWVSLFDDKIAGQFSFDPAAHGGLIPIAIVGHTRAISSTDFKNTVEGAHPHETKTLIGVHNGHIQNWKSIKPEKEDVASDSVALFEFITKNGHENLEKIQGAAACIYFFKNNPFHIYMFSKDRPLSFNYYYYNSLIISSDGNHLTSLIKKDSFWFIRDYSRVRINLNKNCKITYDNFIPIAGKMSKDHVKECFLCGAAGQLVPIFRKNKPLTFVCSSHKWKCGCKADTSFWVQDFTTDSFFRCVDCFVKYLNKKRKYHKELKCDFCRDKNSKIKYKNHNNLIYKLCSVCQKNFDTKFDYKSFYEDLPTMESLTCN